MNISKMLQDGEPGDRSEENPLFVQDPDLTTNNLIDHSEKFEILPESELPVYQEKYNTPVRRSRLKSRLRGPKVPDSQSENDVLSESGVESINESNSDTEVVKGTENESQKAEKQDPGSKFKAYFRKRRNPAKQNLLVSESKRRRADRVSRRIRSNPNYHVKEPVTIILDSLESETEGTSDKEEALFVDMPEQTSEIEMKAESSFRLQAGVDNVSYSESENEYAPLLSYKDDRYPRKEEYMQQENASEDIPDDLGTSDNNEVEKIPETNAVYDVGQNDESDADNENIFGNVSESLLENESECTVESVPQLILRNESENEPQVLSESESESEPQNLSEIHHQEAENEPENVREHDFETDSNKETEKFHEQEPENGPEIILENEPAEESVNEINSESSESSESDQGEPEQPEHNRQHSVDILENEEVDENKNISNLDSSSDESSSNYGDANGGDSDDEPVNEPGYSPEETAENLFEGEFDHGTEVKIEDDENQVPVSDHSEPSDHSINPEPNQVVESNSNTWAVVVNDPRQLLTRASDISTSGNKDLEKELPFECSVSDCPHRVKTKVLLKKHEEGHLKQKRLACYYCNWSANRLDFLDLHMKFHDQYKEIRDQFREKVFLKDAALGKKETDPSLGFACDECDLAFKRSDHLQSHKIKHSNEKQFECRRCGEAFKRGLDLGAHQNSCDKRVRKCDECGETFKNKRRLRRHLKKDHVPECKECGVQVNSRRGLLLHVHYKHPKEKESHPNDIDRLLTNGSAAEM